MATLNKVQLIGNVGNDPEIRTLQGNSKNAQFRLATTTRYKDSNGTAQEETEWHNIVTWNNKADFVEKYIHKGNELYVEGKIKSRSWTDQQGNKRYITEIVADNIQILKDPSRAEQPQAQPVPQEPLEEQPDLPF